MAIVVVAPCSVFEAVTGSEYWTHRVSLPPEAKGLEAVALPNWEPAFFVSSAVPPEQVTLEPLPLTVAPVFTTILSAVPSAVLPDPLIRPAKT